MEMVRAIEEAEQRLEGIASTTPLQPSIRLSEQYGATILIKREDMQAVRSFKIRGAYNKIASLSPEDRKRPVVCASAGNHAQGVAFACAHLGIGGTPFDDLQTIAGQGTVGKEIFDATGGDVGIVIVPIGGGGLASGVASYIKAKNPAAVVVGAEPAGSPSMYESLKQGRIVELDEINTFVDGAAVRKTRQRTFDLCRRYVDRVVLLPEGKVCTTMIELYQNEGIITEPAGALALSALDDVADEIRGKTVVCVLSGGNNDVLRYPEILERSLVYLGRKHYFIIEFAQKPGQLRQFVDDALGPTDDIVRFEYIKKTNKERGAALVGIELKDKADLEPLLRRMEQIQLNFRPLGSEELLYQYLV